MTVRAAILGALSALFICAYTYFNDAVMHQTMFVGNHMPMSVYGGLVIMVLVINPFLRRLSPRLMLSGRELTLVLAMALSACAIPGSGHMRTFTSALLMPRHFARTHPGWTSEGVLDMVPSRMLVDAGENEDVVVNGFVQGLGVGDGHVAFTQVPWYAWKATLVFWVPLVITLWVCLLALAVIVHRQWSEHERLPYPIAIFANAMLPEEGQAAGAVFANSWFRVGAAAVFLIHLNNYAYAWFPSVLLQIPTSFNFAPLGRLFGTITRGGGWFVFHPRLFFTAVAFAYFQASDVSLSLGLGPCLYAYVAGKFQEYGVSISGGGVYAQKFSTFFAGGAYFGTFASVVYSGRRYFSGVFRRAFGVGHQDEIPEEAVWAARLFAACAALFVVQLCMIGLDWQLAILYAIGVMVLYLVVTRIVAETGLFFIQAWWFPCVVLGGMFGFQSMGPRPLLIMMLLTTVLAMENREALMPFVTNSLKVMELRGLAPGRGSLFCAGTAIAGLGLAIPLVLYLQYDLGADLADRWANGSLPKLALDQALQVKQQLQAQGVLETAEQLSGWRRFFAVAPAWNMMAALAAGFVLVTVFSWGRLRFPRWPLHPVLFLIWFTYPGRILAASFLLGWLIKTLVTRYGGAHLHQQLKPLMIGLIVGDMLGGLFPIVTGIIYHICTGRLPVRFSIMPG